ncbi:uncharacterized protein K489DRAFT_156701 [Dissoconium aciculare CBS 342.82]|uniref:Uncharacterized protein n=1 Tax=Dissoconium aciculare CBS 342.82 TaxID=1314786 RepID=A0A6J3MEW0_9PEZI|nr:uncharacterized protein K489DRAFT_156701 [Dissoconium aciculare CBS 342.82]KAF1825402.1 hypothetical protein K489DRAFT_156701 [Dissoconium aciculare CBS 342.82]
MHNSAMCVYVGAHKQALALSARTRWGCTMLTMTCDVVVSAQDSSRRTTVTIDITHTHAHAHAHHGHPSTRPHTHEGTHNGLNPVGPSQP